MPADRALQEWRRLSEAGLNNRSIAAQIGMAEAQLVALGCGSASDALTTRLAPQPLEVLQALAALGPVKFVVRNDHAVMERSGGLQDLQDGESILALGPELRLTLSRAQVASAFALREPRPSGTKRSLQLFDPSGETVMKVVCRDEASAFAFEELAERFRHDEQSSPPVRARDNAAMAPPAGLPAPLVDFLHAAAKSGRPLGISVSNRGARLEATTPIHRVKRSSRAPWINVLDPGLDLHLHEARIVLCSDESVPTGRRVDWFADDLSLAVSMQWEGALDGWPANPVASPAAQV